MTKYNEQLKLRDAYRAAYAADFLRAYTSEEIYEGINGASIAQVVERSIYCADDDPGENTQGGFVTISFEDGIPSPYWEDLELTQRTDEIVAQEFKAREFSAIRFQYSGYFTELKNASVASVYSTF